MKGNALEAGRRSRVRHQAPTLSEYRCRDEPGTRPYPEQHARATLAIVRRGSFCYHLIREGFDSTLPLTDLADEVGLSPFHFLRLFRRQFQVTPHQYLIRFRLKRAVELLLETGRPITDVAFDAGFNDLSNFIRTFHRTVGLSPRALRRKDRKILQVASEALR